MRGIAISGLYTPMWLREVCRRRQAIGCGNRSVRSGCDERSGIFPETILTIS